MDGGHGRTTRAPQQALPRVQLGRKRGGAAALRRLRRRLPHTLHRPGQRPEGPLVLHGVRARLWPGNRPARRQRPESGWRLPQPELLLPSHPGQHAARKATRPLRRVAGSLGPDHGPCVGCTRAGPRLPRRGRLGRLRGSSPVSSAARAGTRGTRALATASEHRRPLGRKRRLFEQHHTVGRPPTASPTVPRGTARLGCLG